MRRFRKPNWATLPAEEKVRIVKAMGFQRTGDNHTEDCPARLAPGEYRCQCVPPVDWFEVPEDVMKFWGQTWEERRDARRKRAG